MNWKFKLLLVGAIILAAAVLLKLPSQADTDINASQAGDVPFTASKVVDYGNGILKIKPQNFAVSGAVKDMPTTDPNSLVNRANFIDPEKLREMRAEKIRKEKGIEAPGAESEEINELNSEEVKKIVPGAGIGYNPFQDPLLKKGKVPDGPQAMPTPSLTFDGATQADNAALGIGPLLPPDPNGDVGPNHYVSAVNLVLKIFNKSGAVVAGPIKTSALFTALPAGDPCRVQNDGDPIVLYDSLADRWHISQFGLPSGNVKYQCVALSVTGDPTGAYYIWSYAYQAAVFNDYPKVGVWTDGYHMTFNQFNISGSQFLGLGILSQDRKRALVGDPNAAAVYFNVGAVQPNSGGALPGDIDGFVGPPDGMAEVIGEPIATDFGDPTDGIRLFKWVPNFSDPSASSFTVLPDLVMTPFDPRNPTGRGDIEQMGGTNLDSISDRSMHRFAYRNFGTTANPINSYLGNFSVNVSGVNPTSAATYQAGVRWFEVRRVNDVFSVFDQGTHNLTPGDGANGLNDWMASGAQDNRGDIAIGFSQAGTGQKADIKIAGRTNNVQNSGTLNEGEALFYPAGGSQTSSSNRWGDYSAMNVDPSDDCTFWYTQEYYATTSNSGWSTRVGKFRFPQCVDAPKATINGTITFCNTGAPLTNASVDATGGFNRVTGADGTFTMTVSPGTYTVTGSKLSGYPAAAQNVTVGAGQTGTVNICLTGVPVVAQSGDIQFVSESCGLPNGAPDPGETLTVSLPLQNTGAANNTNLTAVLLATGGVTNPSAAQNYGALVAGGSATVKTFTFRVDPNLSCGSSVTLTFSLTDGNTSFGTITRTYTTGVRVLALSENFDGVTAPALPPGWTANITVVGTTNSWVTSTTNPNSPPNAAFAADPNTTSGTTLVSPAVSIQAPDAQISFKNSYNTEPTWDGMVLEYSIDGGSTWTDVIAGGGSFVTGGYSGLLGSGTNPLAGRQAWTGNSNGYVNTVVNLPASLAGQKVIFRWYMGSDSSVGSTGVFIDDVQIYGSRACNSCGPTPCRFQRRFDFDGDGKADISVYRPGNGAWYSLNSQNGFSAAQFGVSTDKIVPADYDGDGKTDLAVYRGGTWYIQRSTAGFIGIAFGAPDDIPMPADFDGDGKAELVVFRPSNGTWYTYNLATNQTSGFQFGQAGDIPVVGDYDGDCKADFAVFRPSQGTWYIQRSRDGFTGVQFGAATDKPVPADYDGDGKTDIAVFRPSNGAWYLLRSTAGFTGYQFGFGTDLPVPADYDGDGKADIAVFRPSNGTWYLQQSANGFTGIQFGLGTDLPIQHAYIP